MTPVSFKWIFLEKQLDRDGLEFVYKARYVIRGDKQESYVDFNHDNLYAPVAAQKRLPALFAFAESTEDIVETADIFVEGEDVTNAYIFGKLDITTVMEQPWKLHRCAYLTRYGLSLGNVAVRSMSSQTDMGKLYSQRRYEMGF